jgi:hypothetical protein
MLLRAPQETPNLSVAMNDSFLRANSAAYESLVKKARSMDWRKDPETFLRLIEKIAGFAAGFHSGRFADGAIENRILEIGAGLRDLLPETVGAPPPVMRKKNRRQVLHVSTSVSKIGGHTRFMYHWIRNDKSACHSLILTNQADEPIPSWLAEAVERSGGRLTVLQPEMTLCEKALRLRQMARESISLAVLHHFGADVVPTIAFAASDCPPVAVLNHADHLFWLGSSVTDMVINLRSPGANHTAERRFVPCNYVLPVPLPNHCTKGPRADARRMLNIDEEQIVLLSIGRAEKYRTCGSYSFVATANKILDRHPRAHLYVVGESASRIAPYLRCAIHDRLHFVGSMESPSLYHDAADIYLESFPFGSQTALLEAAMKELPVIPAYAPLSPLLVANDDALADILHNPRSEQEYIERVGLMIRHPEQRITLGETLRKRLLADHVGDGWLKRLAGLYQETDRLVHRPRPIPISSCSTTEMDIGLSLWRVMADGRSNAMDPSIDTMGSILLHNAFVAKDVGDYAKARLFSWRAVCHNPYQRASWRLLAIALLGRSGRLIKKVLFSHREKLANGFVRFYGRSNIPQG